MTKSPPKLIIFAGANGSGKTTVARRLLPKIKVKEFVNADDISRGLSPFNPTQQAMAAGRLVLKRIDELLREKKSFPSKQHCPVRHILNTSSARRN